MPYHQRQVTGLLVVFTLVASVLAWPLCSFAMRDENSPISLVKRDPGSAHFRQQFRNPKEVMSLLLLVGADIVQKAVAQMTGGRHQIFTPVVFSFGWVSYAVNSASNAVGDGRFLPKPDYSGTVVVVGMTGTDKNSGQPYPKLGLGDKRENKSWLLGRLIRDLELQVERSNPEACLRSGMIVTFWQVDGGQHSKLRRKRDWLWWSFTWGIALQLGVAAIPWGLDSNWSIFFITGVGNLLAMLTASLPSMRKEGTDVDYHSRNIYALTSGNGHKHVFIIQPDTFSQSGQDNRTNDSKLPHLDHIATSSLRASKATRVLSVVLAVLWMLLLIAVSGLERDTWYLLIAGLLGMVLNIMVSSWYREPAAHGLPLIQIRREMPNGVTVPRDESHYFGIGFKKNHQGKPKARKVLLKLERAFPGFGHALRPLFFNGLEGDMDQDWKKDKVSWETAEERLREVCQGDTDRINVACRAALDNETVKASMPNGAKSSYDTDAEL